MNTKQGKYHTFYTSSNWLYLRKKVLIDNHYLCQECKKIGKIKKAIVGHHIKPIDKYWELRLDYSNILPVCRECHERLEGRENKLHTFLQEWSAIK